jgi:CheY-like chemotaxis protein
MPDAKSKFKLLVAEDNSDELQLFQFAIKKSALEPLLNVQVVKDGEEALHALDIAKHDSSFDLVLLDLNMPKVSGKEVLNRLRKDYKLDKIPVIIFSNSPDSDGVENYPKTRADGYVQKPLDLRKLVDFCSTIRKSIESQGKISMEFICKEYPFCK